MKKFCRSILIILLGSFSSIHAQELRTDSIINPEQTATIKEYGEFLIDMGLLGVSPVQMPQMKFDIFPEKNDIQKFFQIDTNEIYAQKNLNTGFSYNSLTGSTEQWQTASFKLKNGMKLNTYGNFNAEGYRVHDPSALPWERNNFKGAFELKSANGAFGIKVEVRKENAPYYPY